MAETERPHRSSTINSSNNANPSSTDHFICFTSHFSSSSSMRLSSKSILSPARSACLTNSLSRRLRNSSSFKSGSAGVLNSPMLRKRSGSGYGNDNIEPSSPKVTCIGQVRVKTRKHVKKKMRARSRRNGEMSLRRSSVERNDRGGCRFGSELNCFFPCRDSSYQNRDRDVEEFGGGNGCGAVFTRWFVAVEESGGKRREIELVVGGEDDAEEDRRRSRRRHVFEGIDLSEIEMKSEKKEREIGRSPPKNALLLMRCRSDPVKVAALANRVRERQMSLNYEALGRNQEEDDERRRIELEMEDKKRIELCEKWISGETTMVREVAEVTLASNPAMEDEENVVVPEDSVVEGSKILEVDSFEEEIIATFMKNIEDYIRNAVEEEEHIVAVAAVDEEQRKEKEVAATETQNEERSEQGNREPDIIQRNQQREVPTENEKKSLPDCLLLMMCEPKLSMEVSKETWVCSTDFVRGKPPAKKIPETAREPHNNQPKKRVVTTVDSNASSRRCSIDKQPVHQALLQPPRSSCSYPAAPPIITAVGEPKVTRANKVYEPPLLPRCKSEPRKTALKLAPEACFWKNRKLEPPATIGVSVAGLGF